MKATAAVLYEVKKPLVIEDVEVLEPGPHEVQVRWAANGVCHSDLHVITGDSPHPCPWCWATRRPESWRRWGPGGDSLSPATTCARVTFLLRPVRVLHRWPAHHCALRDKPRWFMLDGTPRFRKNGQGLHHYLQVAGTPRDSVLPEESVIPIRKDAPLDVVCLVSCGVLGGAGPVFNQGQGAARGQRGRVRLRGRGPQHHPGRSDRGGARDHCRGRDEAEARLGPGIRGYPRGGRLEGRSGRPGAPRSAAPEESTTPSRSWGPRRPWSRRFYSTHRGGTAVVVGVCPAGTRLHRPHDAPPAAHAYRLVLRRRPPADRRAHADRPVHGRPVQAPGADQPPVTA